MIITTLGIIIGMIASHAAVGFGGWYFNNLLKTINTSKELKIIETARRELPRLEFTNNTLVPGELSTEIIPEVVMTTEEHLKYLCNLYPDATKEYKRYHTEHKILDRADRYILRLILAYDSGDLTAEIGTHTLNFANGDKIWISNKYYGYGNLHSSEHNPHVCFDTTHNTVSLYTFLRIVDLEERIAEPVLHLSPVRVEN
jgi:hypothetical protein